MEAPYLAARAVLQKFDEVSSKVNRMYEEEYEGAEKRNSINAGELEEYDAHTGESRIVRASVARVPDLTMADIYGQGVLGAELSGNRA